MFKVRNKEKVILASLGVYFIIRLFGYYFQPGTTLNSIVSIFIVIATIFLFSKKSPWGWYIVGSEIILGGAGNYLSALDISVRTILLVVSITIFILYKVKDKKILSLYNDNKAIIKVFVILYGAVLIGVINGYVHNNNLSNIFGDTIPYLYLLYYFPLKELLSKKTFSKMMLDVLIGGIIGLLVFTLFTFMLFSTNITFVHGNYYGYLRVFGGSKVTDLGNNFFRIVFNEQLLVVPLFIFLFTHSLKKNTQKIGQFASALSLLIMLSINLSRIYLLALIACLASSISRIKLKKWLLLSATSIIIVVASFIMIHYLASEGASSGIELFSYRIKSIAVPDSQLSSLSRMLLLPKITKSITSNPIIGTGLGSTLTVWSPVAEKYVTTPHFDWGYLEIVAELGMLGLFAWLVLLIYLIRSKKSKLIIIYLFPLLIINLTSPALFHIMGIIWLVVLLAFRNTRFS